MSDPRPATPVELIRALAVLAEPPGPEHGHLARLIGREDLPDGAAYADVFAFQLYPYASVHLGAEGMMGGDARDRVAGFWRALGQSPPAEPDHLSALLGLYATLSEQAAGGQDAHALLVAQSRAALLHEHLAPWVFSLLGRVAELSPGFYAYWAELLHDVLRAEVGRGGARSDGLPRHLAEAPALRDPRVEGDGSSFLEGVLAPVRCGMIVTRSDLARIARETRLGLRAGERRYALENLFAQDPVAVLSSLTREAQRHGALHRSRESWLGDIAAFHAERADTAARLFRDLAREGDAHWARAREAEPIGARDGGSADGPDAAAGDAPRLGAADAVESAVGATRPDGVGAQT